MHLDLDYARGLRDKPNLSHLGYHCAPLIGKYALITAAIHRGGNVKIRLPALDGRIDIGQRAD